MPIHSTKPNQMIIAPFYQQDSEFLRTISTYISLCDVFSVMKMGVILDCSFTIYNYVYYCIGTTKTCMRRINLTRAKF